MDERVDWSVLPDEIWSAIGKRFDNRIDVLRFRSVCRSWRSFIPPFNDSSPPLRLRFPLPFLSKADAFVSQNTVYRIDPPHEDQDPSFSSSGKGWLVKVEEFGPGKVRLLDLISSHRIRDFTSTCPKVFSSLEFRMAELSKAYSLRYVCGSSSISGINKVILAPNCIGLEDSAIFVIYDQGKLGFAKNGAEDFTLIDNRILDYNDIIVYMGQPYVVDRWGTVSWIDSSLRVIQFSPPLFGFGSRKHLVVSCGELYVVDRYLDRNENMHDGDENNNSDRNFNAFLRHPLRRRRYDYCQAKTVDFKVHKLDEEWGRWVEVKTLGDQAIVLGSDCCFSVSAREFAGFKGNCIYFTEQLDLDFALRGLGNLDGCVFDLEDRTIEKLAYCPGSFPMFSLPQNHVHVEQSKNACAVACELGKNS
ncbi:hypothetical protein FNV43_RR18655 [Rhamnella rubrinervis]|uniref:F-box domain-containing protein n=1 Tax=Rhamnella rubrinervis TaxID=2594499 RepID=A0A8K0E4Z6_9ROSA|nr:hypothetical protein FNV43_RR18655 [Rhamnella rubrinervis]